MRRKEEKQALQQQAKRRKTGDKDRKKPATGQWWQDGTAAPIDDNEDDRAAYRAEVRAAAFIAASTRCHCQSVWIKAPVAWRWRPDNSGKTVLAPSMTLRVPGLHVQLRCIWQGKIRSDSRDVTLTARLCRWARSLTMHSEQPGPAQAAAQTGAEVLIVGAVPHGGDPVAAGAN